MKAIGIIPCRYGSTRFPVKPLIDILGKSMIQRVHEQSIKSTKLNDLIIATDDSKIFNHVLEFGGKAVMTSKNHNTSIYIFGDEFTGGSYTPVFSTIKKLSTRKNIRISGVGFISLGITNDRFATLMREIAENNNGTFLGLPVIGMDLRQ